MFCYYSSRSSCIWGHMQPRVALLFGLHEWLWAETGFSIVFTDFFIVLGKIQASNQKRTIVECSVVLSAFLAECLGGHAEGCCSQMLFDIPQTLWLKFLEMNTLANCNKGASGWVPEEGNLPDGDCGWKSELCHL